METRSNHILVGAVVLALIGAVVLFLVWLSQAGGNQDKRYDILFKTAVDGLAKGSSVTFSGVPVGQVESINLVPQTPEVIRVRISVNSTTPVLVGTFATIKGVGFTGVSAIQLDPPESDQRRVTGLREITCPDVDRERACPFGEPVIPTKPGALGQLLNSAPELLERVSTLTLKLTELLSDRNQNSIAAILENVQVISKNLAQRSDEIAATMADARIAIRQAGDAAESFGKLADTSNDLLAHDARPLIADLRKTVQSADASMKNLDAAIGDARPGLQNFSKQTIPEVGQLVRDLREMSSALSAVAQRLNQQGAGGIVGGQKLPDYNAGKR
jgi:phospholipid/cholesterol/gamma-HCH transport system substrate-binding protein